VRRNFYDAVFLEQGVFGEHAINAAAERAFVRVGRRLAAAPALKEIPGDAIANLHPRHAWTDFDRFAGAVRKRDEVFAHRHAIAAPRNGEIAEIERARLYLHQHLPMGGLGVGAIDLDERFDPGAAFGQLIGTHDFPPSYCGGS